MQEIQPRITLEDLFPEVSRPDAVPRRISPSPGTAWPGGALVERKEVGPDTFEAGGDVDLVSIKGKMHDRATAEQFVQWITVYAILTDGITHVLSGELLLDLRSCNGQPIDKQRQVKPIRVR